MCTCVYWALLGSCYCPSGLTFGSILFSLRNNSRNETPPPPCPETLPWRCSAHSLDSSPSSWASPARPLAPLPHYPAAAESPLHLYSLLRDQTTQIGRRMVSQGYLGHHDWKGTEENIMALLPLKHADS